MSAPDGFSYGPADPVYVAPDPLDPTPGGRLMAALMVIAPVLTCGALAFAPSVWVAMQRRRNRRLLARALVTAGGFLAVYVVGAALVVTAPVDDTGDPAGGRGYVGIAMVVGSALLATFLAVLQKRPKDALRPT
jgi:hypothetical protein